MKILKLPFICISKSIISLKENPEFVVWFFICISCMFHVKSIHGKFVVRKILKIWREFNLTLTWNHSARPTTPTAIFLASRFYCQRLLVENENRNFGSHFKIDCWLINREIVFIETVITILPLSIVSRT